MLKRLHLRNFTVFADAEFEFGEGLNVLVGANGTGKTHVLKAGYGLIEGILNNSWANDKSSYDAMVSIPSFQGPVDFKIKSVFQPHPFFSKELIRRSSIIDEAEMLFDIGLFEKKLNVRMRLTNARPLIPVASGIDFVNTVRHKGNFTVAAFIPAKEVLTFGWLLPLYNRREIPVDETYPDLLRLLSGPPLRQPEPAHIVEKLAQLIGGKVEEEGGHFYLAAENQPRLEMNLVAEGMRKFATLYKLLANGTLTPETTLFWDEPEANLNPALLKDMASVLTDLAQAGFQIILATHSLFLMRELHILAQQKKKPVRYFGLYAGEDGAVQVERQDDLVQLQHLVALDAELAQTFDFEAALDDDYAGDS
jgi:energy-coupling factor transporter ATP-binding protein EcfA2